jgi:hypothetical protein
MEITNTDGSVEVLHHPGCISLDTWQNHRSGDVISIQLTPEDALMIAAALQKAAMAELEL